MPRTHSRAGLFPALASALLAVYLPAFAFAQPGDLLPPPAFGTPRPADLPPPVPAAPSGSVASPPGGGLPATREELNRVIADALKQHDEAKQAEAEKKKQEDEEKKRAEGYVVGTVTTLEGIWRDGIYWESPNKDFTVHLGGWFHYDGAWYDADDRLQQNPPLGVGKFQDGVFARRLRLRVEGTIWEVLDYMLEFEFANGVTAAGARGNNPNPATVADTIFNTPAPTEAWLQWKSLPIIGNIRVGNQKEPFSFEHVESDRFIPFMERSFLFDGAQPSAFNSGFSPGLLAYNSHLNDRLYWALGVFKNESDQFGYGVGDGEYAVTGRLTGLPYYEADGLYVVHIGAAGSHRDPDNDRVNVRIRDAVRGQPQPLQNSLINTGLFVGERHDLLQLEAAVIAGPLTLQAEYLGQKVEGASKLAGSTGPSPTGDPFFNGYYVQATYYLTGEHDFYDRQNARLNRPRPLEPFYFVRGRSGLCHGKGAWQLGARYEQFDATDAGIHGGVLRGVTLGLSWYLNPNARLTWNYDATRRSDAGPSAAGTVQGFGMRVAMDF